MTESNLNVHLDEQRLAAELKDKLSQLDLRETISRIFMTEVDARTREKDGQQPAATDESRLITELLARSAAIEFGALDAAARAALLSAAQHYVAGGREAITADEMALLLANKATGPIVSLMCEREAEASPIYQELLAITGQQSPSALRAERARLAADLAAMNPSATA